MLRKTCIVCMLFLSTLTIGCSQKESNKSKVSNVQGQSNKFVVPREYNHAKDMLDYLNKQGINVQEIKNSNAMALFDTKSNYSMFIKTDAATFELIHLENKNGKELAIVKQETTDGRYRYAITKNGANQQLYDANVETNFNITDEYISITRVKELNDKIKNVLESQQK